MLDTAWLLSFAGLRATWPRRVCAKAGTWGARAPLHLGLSGEAQRGPGKRRRLSSVSRTVTHTEEQWGRSCGECRAGAQGEGWEQGREDRVGLSSGRGWAGREGL